MSDLEKTIRKALERQPVDVDTLRAFAKFGFINHDLRRQVWRHLLGVSEEELKVLGNNYTDHIYVHKYFDQISKDIDRSMFHFDITRAYTHIRRIEQRRVLERIIHALFCHNPDLHYIQGFHDIASVFVIVCGEPDAFVLLERLSLLHLKDSLRSSLEVVMQVLNCVFPLIALADPPLHDFMARSGVMSFVLLSWLLTWFSHNIERFDSVVRVFDLLIASHPAMPIYLTASLVIQLRTHILACECDMPAMHAFFQNIPPEASLDRDVDAILLRATELFEKWSPATLFGRLSSPPAPDPDSASPPQQPLLLPTDSILLVSSAADVPSRVASLMATRVKLYSAATATASSTAASNDASDTKSPPAPAPTPVAPAAVTGDSDAKSAPAATAAATAAPLTVATAAGAIAPPLSGPPYDLSRFEDRYWTDRKRDAREREQQRIAALIRTHTAAMKKKAALASVAATAIHAVSVTPPPPAAASTVKPDATPNGKTEAAAAGAESAADTKSPPAVVAAAPSPSLSHAPSPAERDEKSPPASAVASPQSSESAVPSDADAKTPPAQPLPSAAVAADVTTAANTSAVTDAAAAATTAPAPASATPSAGDAPPVSPPAVPAPAPAPALVAPAAVTAIPGMDDASLEAVKATPKTARELEQERMRTEIDNEQWNNAKKRLICILPIRDHPTPPIIDEPNSNPPIANDDAAAVDGVRRRPVLAPSKSFTTPRVADVLSADRKTDKPNPKPPLVRSATSLGSAIWRSPLTLYVGVPIIAVASYYALRYLFKQS